MKKVLLLLLFAMNGMLQAKRTPSDRVLVNLHHTEGRVLILQSDLRPDLSGNVPTLQDMLLRELILLDAKKMKIPVSSSDVDRHIARVQEQLKMTRTDLIDFFKERGFSFEEARKELEKGLIIEMAVEHRIKSKSYVSKIDLEKYDNEHPEIFYTIKQAFVPFGGGSKAISRAVIDQEIATGAITSTIQWQDSVVLKGTDFSLEKAYIKDLSAGSVSRIHESEDGITLLQVVEKKRTPLEERKHEIAGILGKDRYKQALTEYYDKLLKDAKPYTRFIDKGELQILA